MIEKYGQLVVAAINSLSMAERQAQEGPMLTEHPSGAQVSRDVLPLTIKSTLDSVRRLCILTDWDGLEPAIVRLERGSEYLSRELIAHEIRSLRFRIQDDLKQEFFFHLSPADVPLYQADQPFGPKVGRRFPKASEDIAEAAKCLALHRWTAAVFHLMRVMELALRALAKKLNITAIDPDIEYWNKITDHVNKAITALPAKTAPEQARKAKFGAASAHLNSVRIAWRNEVMHPKQSYSQEEAHAIFAAVRAFMIDLETLK